MTHQRLSDCDLFFLTYDEPRAELFWEQARGVLPGIQRVHGIKGFDAAYKECARRSSSPRFFTIDGDNEIHPSLCELNLDFSQYAATAVLSWSAKNSVNGLRYGNGGIKNWPRSVVEAMQTHESADQEEGAVDFCFQLNYFQMPSFLSTASIHHSPYQAFRAGFREGVKMCLERGQRPPFDSSNPRVIAAHVAPENLDRLKIWCSVGADVENGRWAMLGARKGCQFICLSKGDHRLIRDYDWFQYFWWEKIWPETHGQLDVALDALERELNQELGLGIKGLDPASSIFFKSVYLNPPRNGLMYK